MLNSGAEDDGSSRPYVMIRCAHQDMVVSWVGSARAHHDILRLVYAVAKAMAYEVTMTL